MDILNEKIEGLVKKAEKSGMPYGILKKVYDRGMAAWKTGHRPGTTPQQWAFARVNSFVTKSSGTWGKADKDLADKVRGAKKEEIENPKNAKDILGQIREARYKIGFEKGEVDMVISDRPGELAVIVQDELDSERIRAKVKSTGDEFTLEFNTSIPQRKMIKILDDKFGYTAFAESKELVKEKLPKDADAGDYVKDFRKSKAPQFKGKSDKKIQKMAIAAYLDSKEEVEVKEGTWELPKTSKQKAGLKHAMKIPIKLGKEGQNARNVIGPFIGDDVLFDDLMDAGDKNPRGDARPIIKKAMKRLGIKEENIQESGHTDVASMKTQVQIATDALQKMNTELGKLGDEDDLPTWWTNKVATAVNKLDGMADYIDAMHDRGKEMNEGKRQLKDPKKETMVMKVKDASSIQVIDKKDLKKYTSKGYIQVESNLQEKEKTYTVIHIKKGKEIIKTSKGTYDAAKIYAKMKGLRSTAGVDVHLMEDNITEETVFVVRFEKEGMRFAVPFRDMKMAKDGEKILKKSAGVSGLSITKDVLKPGIKFSRKEGRIVKEENLEVSEVQEVDNSLAAQATRVISKTAIKEKKDPADIDFTATDLDRKAADKNIFVQLKRAQDMKGKGDIEFLDKKKKKVDIRIINKAIDMMMKMKPADRAKMQTAIGKSYKDLLKTVQRGKV